MLFPQSQNADKEPARELEVRFAERLLSIITVTLSDPSRKVWGATAAPGSRADKNESRGLLRKWAPGGQTERRTPLMADMTGVLCRLQRRLCTVR